MDTRMRLLIHFRTASLELQCCCNPLYSVTPVKFNDSNRPASILGSVEKIVFLVTVKVARVFAGSERNMRDWTNSYAV